MPGEIEIEYAEATPEQRLRAYWHAFCDADPVPEDFPEDMERAGLTEAVPTTGREHEQVPLWYEKYGDWVPPFVWKLTEAGRAALQSRSTT